MKELTINTLSPQAHHRIKVSLGLEKNSVEKTKDSIKHSELSIEERGYEFNKKEK